MIEWSISAAINADCFDRIIVSTDDSEISKLAKSSGAEAPFIRPQSISEDYTPTGVVVKHALEWLELSDLSNTNVCCLYATAPFVTSNDINQSLSILNPNVCDFVLPVTSYAFPIQRALIIDEKNLIEQEIVSGVSYSKNESMITISGIQDKPGISARIFGLLASHSINVDMIVQSSSADRNATDLSFTVPKSELNESLKVMNSIQKEIGFETITTDSDVAKIAVIGIGMKSQSGVAQKMFDTLAEKSINLKVISTSEIKISVLIDAAYMELAARSLHTAFDLDVK